MDIQDGQKWTPQEIRRSQVKIPRNCSSIPRNNPNNPKKQSFNPKKKSQAIDPNHIQNPKKKIQNQVNLLVYLVRYVLLSAKTLYFFSRYARLIKSQQSQEKIPTIPRKLYPIPRKNPNNPKIIISNPKKKSQQWTIPR